MEDYFMDIERIWNNEKQLISLTGTTKAEINLIDSEIRIELIKMGHFGSMGRPPKVGIREVILMLLMNYRHNLPLDAIGALFGLDNSNVKRWIADTEEAFITVLEKKDLHHLLEMKRKSRLKKDLNPVKKSILMALNSRFADLPTK